MGNDQVMIQVIIGLTSIVGTYLTVKYKPRLIKKLKNVPEIDRAHFLFDGYEKLIKELQRDLDTARSTNDRQAKTIEHMQEKVDVITRDLRDAQAENRKLRRRLGAYGENGA